jgi:hypothetical protein
MRKIKSAFVLSEKEGSIVTEDMWDELRTAIPKSLKNAGVEAVYFVGHSHTPRQKRSVFQSVDRETIPSDFLEGVVRDNLRPVGYVSYVSEKEFDIAKQCSSAPNPDDFQESEVK